MNKKFLSNKNIKKMFYLFIFLIIAGFIFTESLKITLASREWNKYKNDFEWIKEHTDKDALIIPGYQCLAYHVNRATLSPTLENLKKADYIWASQNFNLEGRSIINGQLLKEVEKNNYAKVYENPKTGTIIYNVK